MITSNAKPAKRLDELRCASSIEIYFALIDRQIDQV